MNRRIFLETVALAGSLGVVPLAANAARLSRFDTGSLDQHSIVPVHIVHRINLAPATAVARYLGTMLRAVGISPVMIPVDPEAFTYWHDINALADGPAGTHVIALLDDSSAMLLRQVATARNGTCLEELHLRFVDGGVRHSIQGASVDDPSRTWSEPITSWAHRLAHRHAVRFLDDRPIGSSSTGNTYLPTTATGLVSLVIAL